MSEPRFTVVATVRNEARTIDAFIQSLLAQRRVPDEIVIVDGASSDGTREILEGYAARGVLTLISRPCNIAAGRNLGITAATGTHIAVTDAGCRVDPDWLAQIARCFAADPAPDVVAGNFRFETHTRFEEAVVRGTFQPNRDQTQAARFYPSSRSVAFARAAWQKAGGYPDWLYAAEDTLFNIRLRQLGCRFVFCRDAVVHWRPRETWRALARQRINFARGNARVGIGTAGYLINLRLHAALAVLLLAGLWFPPSLVAALSVLAWHVHRHLWSHATLMSPGDPGMRLRVLAVMEFVRIVSLYGFLRGRWDRISDPSFLRRQTAYMGVTSVDHLDLSDTPGDFRRKSLSLPPDRGMWVLAGLGVFAAGCGIVAWLVGGGGRWTVLLPALAVAGVGTVLLLVKSLLDFSYTGPLVPKHIRAHYRRYTLLSLARLSIAAFAIMLFAALLGVLVYWMLAVTLSSAWSGGAAAGAATLGILCMTALQFVRMLRFNPGLLVASMHYRMSRFYRLWRWMTPGTIRALEWTCAAAAVLLLVSTSQRLVELGQTPALIALWAAALSLVSIVVWAAWLPEAGMLSGAAPPREAGRRPNVLMIGSDTLRADRLSTLGYHRPLTPHIDRLAAQGTLFPNCYVPCARTAPSLISLMTGTWPHTHGIRDNFAADGDTLLQVEALPQSLKAQGYRTAVISDWCGADMGKFSFGFEYTDLPKDQWNLKYLIRQGPKDLRLFISLFAHNRIGRIFLPEIYYLGGVPLTQQIGRRARRLLARLAESEQPFLLNVFYSTTHPPFASEWPWYMRFADPAYGGESKFAMARLTDPFDIIRRQGAPKEEFDLDQIIDLYDGCVAEFDDEVGRMLRHLEACGLADNTIVVVYSDHGMEFFEHGTWGQGNSALGDFSPRIPLLIRDPRVAPRGKLEQVIRSIDFAPTLLELVGCPPSAAMEGVSLAGCIARGEQCPALDAFNETGVWISDTPGLPARHLRYPNLLELLEVPDRNSGTLAIKARYHDIILRAKDRMLRHGRWKLVYQPLETGYHLRLFDLATDPACQLDISERHPEVSGEFWDRLRRFVEIDQSLPRG